MIRLCKLVEKLDAFDRSTGDTTGREVMFKANFAKFTQNGRLMAALVDTGDKYLIEPSSHDLFWRCGCSLRSK